MHGITCIDGMVQRKEEDKIFWMNQSGYIIQLQNENIIVTFSWDSDLQGLPHPPTEQPRFWQVIVTQLLESAFIGLKRKKNAYGRR